MGINKLSVQAVQVMFWTSLGIYHGFLVICFFYLSNSSIAMNTILTIVSS